jgi:hypothetical protein
VPGTLFIYFLIFLTIHTHYSSSGCSPAGYSFFLSWVTDSCIWANNFLPAGPRVGCRAGFEPRAAVQQPSTLTTKPCCTLTQNCKMGKIKCSLCLKKTRPKSQFLTLKSLLEPNVLIRPEILILPPTFQMPASSVVGLCATVEILNSYMGEAGGALTRYSTDNRSEL